jgi:hypothetical protein
MTRELFQGEDLQTLRNFAIDGLPRTMRSHIYDSKTLMVGDMKGAV